MNSLSIVAYLNYLNNIYRKFLVFKYLFKNANICISRVQGYKLLEPDLTEQKHHPQAANPC